MSYDPLIQIVILGDGDWVYADEFDEQDYLRHYSDDYAYLTLTEKQIETLERKQQ